MTVVSLPHVLIDAKPYRLATNAQTPYAEPIESVVVRQAEIPGSSRPSATERPDILSVLWDDWQGGEGRRFFKAGDDVVATQYYRSTAAVDISTPGQIRLGLAVSESLAIATIAAKGAGTARGPQIAITRGNPVVFYTTVGAVNAQERTTSPDTWTARTVAFDGDGPTGPLHARGGILWVGDRGTGAEVHRILTSGTWTDTKFSVEPAESPLLINNRVYGLRDLGTTTPATGRLYEWDPSATVPVTATERILLLGTGSTAFSNLAAISPNLYFVTQDFDGEPAYLWQFDAEDAAGREFLELPRAFRIETTQPWRNVENLNNVLWVGGFEVGATEKAAVLYVTEDGTSGTIGAIRDDTSMRVICLRGLIRNDLYIGTNAGKVFRYDMATGGLSLFADTGTSTDVITGIELAPSGHFYFGVGNAATPTAGSVDRTTPSGTGKYVSASTVESTYHFFGYPRMKKLLHRVTVETETLEAGTSVEIQLDLDGTAITTDAAGATMAHSSGTTTTFTLSNSGTERTFFRLAIKAVLKTSTTANTPKLNAVYVEALPTGFIQFFDMVLDLTEETAGSRLSSQQITGAKQYGTLRTLRDSTSNYLFNFKAPYPEADSPHPGVTLTTHVCKLEDMTPVTANKGETFMRVRLKKMN